jgi:trimeric autotransporter adhesin
MTLRLGATSGLVTALLTITGGAAAQANTNTPLGVNALDSFTTGTMNTGVGYAAVTALNTGTANTGLGYAALHDLLTGNENTAVGRGAMYNSVDGNQNVAMGVETLYENVDGNQNVALGAFALSTALGSSNTAIGVHAMSGNLTGSNNVAIGPGAMVVADDVEGNVAIGLSALPQASGVTDVIAIGREALFACTTGIANTAVGTEALKSLTFAQRNTAVGQQALQSIVGGHGNTAVGFNAGPTGGTMANTGAFGQGAIPTASNRIRIGNDNITNIGGKVGWSNLSDGRFKTKVKEEVPGLAFITKLRPVTYYWDEEKLRKFNGSEPADGTSEAKKYTGFIAQEVEAAAKQTDFDFSGVAAPPNDKTPYQLSYAEFVVPLVKAVQEQQKEIEELRAAAGHSAPPSGTPWLMLLAGVLGGALGSLLILLGLQHAREVTKGARTALLEANRT